MARYVDIPSNMQVIGNIFLNPNLIDNENYTFYEEDFTENIHKVVFGAIYNLHVLGTKVIDLQTIEDYLAVRPKEYAIYKTNNGRDLLTKIKDNVSLASFDYYYQRMKKMTLFRGYQSIGMDLSWLYDNDNILDAAKKQIQENWFDNTRIEDMADLIDKKISDIRLKYVDNANEDIEEAGIDALALLERLRETPEIGCPLYSELLNAVTRGARLKKFYLRSAATGVGKTRAMIADACFLGCDEIYDSTKGQWIKNNIAEPTLYIATEQEADELKTMMIAFLSDVDEEHIITGKYYVGEWERVVHAAEVLQRGKLYIKELPDFSLQDIENIIKRGIRDYEVRYIFHDYLHTSMKILTEITSKTKVSGLREDNILFMISIKLKDLCNKYGVFIMTATQLNGDYRTAKQYDQNLLRGAKSIADKIDCGMIMLEVDSDDAESLKPLIEQNGLPVPEIKISIYKNRRGRYKNILLWCKANRGTCRIEPMFATNYQYELINIEKLKINVKEVEESAF